MTTTYHRGKECTQKENLFFCIILDNEAERERKVRPTTARLKRKIRLRTHRIKKRGLGEPMEAGNKVTKGHNHE